MTMPESRSSERRAGAATILLVEDEPALRHLFATMLVRAGYRILEAADGEEAMSVFDDHGDMIDMVLTDMRMPHMGGAELARQLRARRPRVKVLCVSGYPGADAMGPNVHFLAKPFSGVALLAKVREILDRA